MPGTTLLRAPPTPRRHRPAFAMTALALLAALALAGCNDSPSSTDDYDGDGSSTTDGRVNATVSGSVSSTYTNGTVSGNASAGGGTNGSANATAGFTWTYDNKSGDVSGVALVLMPPPGDDATFEVVNGTTLLQVDVNVTGDELAVTLTPPDCTDDDCVVEVQLTDGHGNLAMEMPAEGTWEVHFEATAQVGPVDAHYELGVAARVSA